MATEVTADQARAAVEQARETEWKLPSFGKELFLGHLQMDLIAPERAVTKESAEKGERFLRRLEAFLREHVDPAEIERDARVPEHVVKGLKEIGALGMKIDERYGGLGLSQLYYCRALELAFSWSPAIPVLLSGHQSIGLPEPLKLFGTQEQKDRWMPRLAKTHISGFMLTERDVGSDPARLAMQAIPTEEGTGYRLTGEKLWGTNGTWADVIVILARVPKSEGHPGGITAFIVPADADGVSVENVNEFMGLRGMDNTVTRLENVFVPTEDVIGAEGRGLKIALTTLNTGRLSVPAMVAAVAKWGAKVAREQAGSRVQWGVPVGRHDPVAQRLAFIAASAFGIESVVEICCRLADDKRNDMRIEAALAKLYSSELGWRLVDDLVQVFGGRGYETAPSLAARGERPVAVEQAMRNMRVMRIFEGTTEIMHLQIAREAVDQHLQVAGDLLEGKGGIADKARMALGAGRFYAEWFPKLAVGAGHRPGSYGEFGRLATHVRFVEREARRLARNTFYGMARWQAGLEQKGVFLGRLVDVGAELFAITCAVVHADALARENPGEAEQTFELADLFCRQARLRVSRLFEDLWSNEDDRGYRFAQELLDSRYAFLERGVIDPSEQA